MLLNIKTNMRFFVEHFLKLQVIQQKKVVVSLRTKNGIFQKDYLSYLKISWNLVINGMQSIQPIRLIQKRESHLNLRTNL